MPRRSLLTRFFTVILSLLSASQSGKLLAQVKVAKPERMPIFITPYYDSKGANGPRISKGEFHAELAKANADSMPELARKMKEKWDTLPVETMYIASIRMYDVGMKDAAVYWFYSAQFRAQLFRALVPPKDLGGIGAPGFERIQAFSSFQKLAGVYINGYGFGDLVKLRKTIETVQSEGSTLPEFEQIYADQLYIDKSEWNEKAKKIADGLNGLIEYIDKNGDEIKAKRKELGTDDKY